MHRCTPAADCPTPTTLCKGDVSDVSNEFSGHGDVSDVSDEISGPSDVSDVSVNILVTSDSSDSSDGSTMLLRHQ